MPPAGNVGFVPQSGALGLALIELARDRAIGVSSFASIGNRADITANDLLEYWEADEGTDVALLYIESFSDPRRFSRLARRIGRRKPIVVVKSGRSTAGARAATSHTGAMLASSDLTADALFRQAGVIRTESLAELLDVASLLSNQPLPAGNRVGIVTNAGGPGDHVRGRVRGRGPRDSRAPRAPAGVAARVPAVAGGPDQPRRHDRDGDRGGLQAGDRCACRLGRNRRADRDLHPPVVDRGRGCRQRRARGRERDRARAADPGRVHVDARQRGHGPRRRDPDPSVPGGRGQSPRSGDAPRSLAGTARAGGRAADRCP